MPRRNIHPGASLGDNIGIHGDLTLAAGVDIGANVTFHNNVVIGENTKVLSGAVIGRPPIRTGVTNREVTAGDATVRIGPNCVIGANAVLYTNLQIAERVLIGDLASIREGCRLAEKSVVGRGVMVMYDTSVGARSRIIDGAIITGNMTIESDVFIGPGVTTVNDNQVYLMRFGLLPFVTKGPTLRRFALIGTGATLAAEVEIGIGAIVAPNAVVTKDVPPWSVAAGVPARITREVDAAARRSILQHFNIAEGDLE